MPPENTTNEPIPERGPVRRAVGPLLEFLATETGGAAILLLATAAALVWVNSPWGSSYDALWHRRISLGVGDARVSYDLRHWVNEGLMTIFFLVVGLEIKRELVAGELDSVRKALLPALAALGGMVVPAVLYLSLNAGGAGQAGWAIPMATDIAFALGALSLFGRSLSASTRVFLLSLAIVDDIGAIVVIAIFYAAPPTWSALLVAVALVAAIGLARRLNVSWTPFYVVAGVALWFATTRSGIHATVAGVALGLMAPVARSEEPEARTSSAERLLHVLHPWTSYAIVPLFALANAGVELSRDAVSLAATSLVAIGIVAGLVVGKLVGILGTTWAAVRVGLAPPPEDGWRATAGVASLAGIGFTVSLFIAGLAFTDESRVTEAKIGILAGSLLASVVGAVVLRVARGRSERSRA